MRFRDIARTYQVKCAVCGFVGIVKWSSGKHGNNPPTVWLCQDHQGEWIWCQKVLVFEVRGMSPMDGDAFMPALMASLSQLGGVERKKWRLRILNILYFVYKTSQGEVRNEPTTNRNTICSHHNLSSSNYVESCRDATQAKRVTISMDCGSN